MNEPLVSIVLLNWNNLPDTLQCLTSIENQRYRNYNIIVVDNGSINDASEEMIREHPEVTVIRLEKNRGYTGGNNIGIKNALEGNPHYLWLMNNDATLHPDCLRNMIDAVDKDETIGLASPCIFSGYNKEELIYCGGYIDMQRRVTANAKNIHEIKEWEAIKPQKVILWGTALLIRKKVIDVIGLLDETFFAYFEDIDYCVRAAQAGFRNTLVENASIFHATSSTKDKKAHYFYYMARNQYKFWMKYTSTVQSRYEIFWVELEKAAVHARDLEKQGRFEASQAVIDGIWNAIIGYSGDWASAPKMPFWLKKILLWHPHMWSKIMLGRIRS